MSMHAETLGIFPGTQAPPARSTARAAEALALHVVGGLHNGACRVLQRQEMLMIGSSPDCDLVLSDAGVARHHCVITRQGRNSLLRAVDEAVMLDGHRLAPGEPRPLRTRMQVSVGSAVIALGPLGQREWPQPAAPRNAGDIGPLRLSSLLVVLAGMGALGFAAALLAMFNEPEALPMPEPIPVVRKVVETMGLSELAISARSDGMPLIEGVVPDAGRAAELKTALKAQAPQAVMQVRTGEDIAEDVAEILRLSGIDARTVYQGHGRVEARGRLGDEAFLESIIYSRAMRDIQGLQKVVAVNYSNGDQPQPRMSPQRGKTVSTVISGRDPYLVTRDGSRYYVGAELPGGARLGGIDGNEVVIEQGGKRQRVKGVGTQLASVSSIDTETN